MFGEERLGEILLQNGTRPGDEIINTVIEGLRDYSCNDDATMMVMRRKGNEIAA